MSNNKWTGVRLSLLEDEGKRSSSVVILEQGSSINIRIEAY